MAAGCIVFWLLAASYCSVGHLVGDDHHQAETGASETVAHHDNEHPLAAGAAEHAPGEASHSHDAEQPPLDSHPSGDGDDACGSSLKASKSVTKAPIRGMTVEVVVINKLSKKEFALGAATK